MTFFPPELLNLSLTRVLPLVVSSNLFFFFCYKKTNIVTYIDVGWAVNHFIVGSYYFLANKGYSNWQGRLFMCLLSLWGLRLGGYLYKRVLNGYSDPRYELLTKKYKNKSLGMFIHFQIQAILVIFSSMPLFYVFKNLETVSVLSWNVIGGSILALGGIVGEMMADSQLNNYQKNKKVEKGDEEKKNRPIFRGGFWKYSRHPNLFFEFATWIGFSVLGIRQEWAYIMPFIGSLFMITLVNFLSVPVTEKHMKSRRDEKTWSDYVQTTNKYFPFFKF